MVKKASVGYRLSPEAIVLIKKLAKILGVSQASIIEIAIRKFSERLGASSRGDEDDEDDEQATS